MRRQDCVKNIGTTLLALALLAGVGFSTRAQTSAGAASLDQILTELSSYNGGIESAPFWKLRDYVYARKDNAAARAECEAKLLEFLAAKATPVAKMAACRMLRLIGTDKSVPVLQTMLLDQATTDMALYAIQKIPGAAVDNALLQALAKADGAIKTEIIAALGERRSSGAVVALTRLLQPGGEFAAAAALALGEIGSDTAANALDASLAGMPADVKPLVAAALMKCAESRLAAKHEAAALALYDKILAEKSLPAATREAAMIGKISASGSAAAAILIDQLKSSDPHMQEAAISKIKDVMKPAAIDPVCKILPGLPESARIKLLAVFSAYPKDRVLATINQAAQSDAAPVRIAALKALESVGDAASVPFLLERAVTTGGAEQRAARDALGALKGRQVDDAVLALLAQKPAEDAQSELLLAVANRRLYLGKSAAAAALASSSSRVRIQALRTLRAIGTPSDMPAVLDLLLQTGDDTERAEAETTTAELARKIANPDGRANTVKDRLAAAKDPKTQVPLYRVLGRIGDDSTLPLIRSALTAPNEEVVDAAVRALVAWPSPAARDDAAELARKSRNETHRLLALQGLLRMIGLERYRKPEAAITDLRQAYLLAARPEEKKLILGLLPRFACPEALDLAGILLGDSAVKAEAQAAIGKLKSQLAGK